ncbi:TolC family protein [Flavobacterium soyangense]|uniref:TolC family protein n=1 Tax=Flavobacterium soyangense TaxID=2023265 RepID=A0A930U630_9FLAO|nr:TolC family protein [Flavobacterium soyangense]MBF2707573.1 TolC family protein [Flavobacterium soyangense]
MKLLLKSIFILYLNIFCIEYTLAQTTSQEIMPTSTNEFNLPPIKAVIDSVLKRNGMVRFRKQHVEVEANKLKSERIYWTRNLGIQADSRYGTFDNTSLSADGSTSTTYINTSTKQWNYGVGLYLKFPVFDILNRKNQINLAKMELEESKSMVQFQEDEIRQTTIKLYQDLILKQKLLQIKSESLGNGKVNMQMVEKEFRNGLVPVAEYVRITSMSSNMESDYESAKSEYLVAKQILEDMAGFVFNVTPSK